MATLNMIGATQFRNFFGSPPSRHMQQLELINVRGVDNSIIRKLGMRSPVFQFESVVDCGSILGARATFYVYTTSRGADPAKLVWAGYDYDMEKVRFAVLDVELLSIQRMAYICGALRPGFTVDLRVRWTGIMVPTE